jgi:hypothetical protein
MSKNLSNANKNLGSESRIRKRISFLKSFNSFQILMLVLIVSFFLYGLNSFYNSREITKIKNEEILKILETPPIKGEETKTLFLPSGLDFRAYKDTTLKIFLNRDITEEEFRKFTYLFNPNYTYKTSFSSPNAILIELPEPKKEDIFLNLTIYINEKEIFSRKFIQDTEEPEKEQPGNYDYTEN